MYSMRDVELLLVVETPVAAATGGGDVAGDGWSGLLGGDDSASHDVTCPSALLFFQTILREATMP